MKFAIYIFIRCKAAKYTHETQTDRQTGREKKYEQRYKLI